MKIKFVQPIHLLSFFYIRINNENNISQEQHTENRERISSTSSGSNIQMLKSSSIQGADSPILGISTETDEPTSSSGSDDPETTAINKMQMR